MRAPGAGAAHDVNVPTAVTRVSAHFVSTSWIAGHGTSTVRRTLTRRTPLADTTTHGRQNVAQQASVISPSHGAMSRA